MPNIFCPLPPNTCIDAALPTANYSSETPDAEEFFGRQYNPALQPPLGPKWTSTGCIGTCVSTLSQQDANECAARQVIFCLSGEWPVEQPNPNPDPNQPPTIFVRRDTFFNDAQSCTVPCADGSVFSYTVPAGTVSAFSLAEANAQAASLACNRAREQKICIGNLVANSVCLGDFYDETVTFEMGVPPAQVAIIAGALPPGLTLIFSGGIFATSFSISGVAAGTGSHAFTIRVNDQNGNFKDKVFNINVATIANTTLANAGYGAPYSATLAISGSINPNSKWTIISGSLPLGLSLNSSTGVISGSSTSEGTYTITVQMEDGQP